VQALYHPLSRVERLFRIFCGIVGIGLAGWARRYPRACKKAQALLAEYAPRSPARLSGIFYRKSTGTPPSWEHWHRTK
jgi:hypothetical protein